MKFWLVLLASLLICLTVGAMVIPARAINTEHQIGLPSGQAFDDSRDLLSIEGSLNRRPTPQVTILRVAQNQSVTVRGQYFPKGETFNVVMTGDGVERAFMVGQIRAYSAFIVDFPIYDSLYVPSLTLWFKNVKTGQIVARLDFDNLDMRKPTRVPSENRYHFPPTVTPTPRRIRP